MRSPDPSQLSDRRRDVSVDHLKRRQMQTGCRRDGTVYVINDATLYSIGRYRALAARSITFNAGTGVARLLVGAEGLEPPACSL
jgi:hypothetical protein